MNPNEVRINLNEVSKVYQFVRACEKFEPAIDVRSISNGRHVVDGKSILGVFSLNLAEDVKVKIISSDEDEILKFQKEMEQFVC